MCVGYLAIVPVLGLSLMQFSQQWQAADVFRTAPIAGPAPLCHGLRRAVLLFLTLPVVILFAVAIALLSGDTSQMLMMIPGVIAIPVFALIPNVRGRGVPLSLPDEAAKSAGRGLLIIAVLPIALAISAFAALARVSGLFWWFVLVETVIAIGVYVYMRRLVARAKWPPLE
jgi:hypothetical protein